jgi:hypothetical protein
VEISRHEVVWIKLGIWLVLGGLIALARRQRALLVPITVLVFALAVGAAFTATYRIGV